ncbi:hypothetical protein TNIN_333881 [Trichonephila inaurata madagascariensis]|uniref:Uncharacterized protein n=1 Tax=Trichonephila inaurata madagascariensis TaxID=2747483 RepID=A0A8X6YFL1_9ARAC|nr:hypothetical protein TNIN_333881 [Trichonephila inaurata madagascariensis]
MGLFPALRLAAYLTKNKKFQSGSDLWSSSSPKLMRSASKCEVRHRSTPGDCPPSCCTCAGRLTRKDGLQKSKGGVSIGGLKTLPGRV